MDLREEMLTTKQKQIFLEDGYLVVENVLPKSLTHEMLEQAQKLSACEPERQVWKEKDLFHHSIFQQLLNVPALVEVAQALIGEDIQLLALDLRPTRARQKNNVWWHRDVTFICNKTLAVNTCIYLQDATETTGSLWVVPGSHRWERLPEDPFANHISGEIHVMAPAGSAVFHESGLWHAAGTNSSDIDSWAIFPHFGKYWIKQIDNFSIHSLPDCLVNTQDSVKQQLLGLKLRSGIDNFLL